MRNKFEDNRWENESFEDNQLEEKNWEMEDMEENFHEDNFEEDEYEVKKGWAGDSECKCGMWDAPVEPPCHFEEELWEEPFHGEGPVRESEWEENYEEEASFRGPIWEESCQAEPPCRRPRKCREEAPCRRPIWEDECYAEAPCRKPIWEDECYEKSPCRRPLCEDRCNESKCSKSSSDKCRYTLAAILKRLARYGCGVPVSVYLNVPGELDVHSHVDRTNLQVANNANVQGATASKTISVTGTGSIPSGAIQVSSTGTVDIPGLEINPIDTRTVEGVFLPISISSKGNVLVDLSSGVANGNLTPIEVRGTAAGQTITVPIAAVDTLFFDTGSVDYADIPELEICCTPCAGGTITEDQICGCLKFKTEAIRIATEGTSNFIELPVTVAGETTAQVRSSSVTGTTVQSAVSLGLSGEISAPVTVESSTGSGAPLPRLGVQGRTNGAPGVALASTGGNTSAVPVTTSVSGTIEPITVAGSAATRGLPVTGTIHVDTDIRHAHIKFTGIIECVDGNFVTLREMRSNKKVVISLCDVIKITFPSFRGIKCMASIFECNQLDKWSCAYGIQKNLYRDAAKPGYIELYSSGTFNPIAEAINTNSIRIVDGGIMWVSERHGCRPSMHTVYSLCNVAGYVFSPYRCE